MKAEAGNFLMVWWPFFFIGEKQNVFYVLIGPLNDLGDCSRGRDAF